ncbi:Glycosyl hydrolase, BNR repeat-containing protein [Candidatus Sulfopaludibacter sp. SbA6]|nr:Glycosyl hydrolase, BNR repeat-containing protein [Candidatus Sulfopaludibacter sp. SbA6]
MSWRVASTLWRAAALASAACLVSAQPPQIGSELLSQLRYRYIGPVGNRVIAAAGILGDPNVYYAGAASGGIFKTTDGGIHWEPVFDGQPVSSVGSLAIAPSDPNVVWAGTGETFIRSHISVGAGIYKSMDAGKTWTLMGLEKTGRIGRLLIDPRNPDIVFACALGHAYGPQPERGVFRTVDGGRSWEQVLSVDPNTGCSDMAMDPANPRILFAGMWQLELHTWNRTSGGPGSGLYKSTDGGATWQHLTGRGLPNSPLGKIGLAMARRSSRVYALIETGDGVPYDGKPTDRGQLWKSDDGGDRWELMSYDRNLTGRAAYYTRCAVSPDNENEVYFLTAAFSRTLDGGRTLTAMPALPGGDNHDMWIDPGNGDRMAVANDSGFSISVNRGRTWNRVQLPIAQMYHVTVDNQVPYFVYGNKQDGNSYRGPSNSLSGGRGGGGGGEEGAAPGEGGGRGALAPPFGPISRSVWHPVAGGESGFATPDPVDNNIIWSSASGSGSVGGIVTVFDERNHQARNVEVWPEQTSGATAAELKYRFNWEFPVMISPHDHNKVYVGSQFVHVTTDGGQSWKVISPDLTRNDKSRMGFSGGLTGDNIGVEYAGVVFALAEAPKEPGVIWAGTNDGLVQITRDGGKTWTNVTANIPGLPEWGTVSNIEASRYANGAAYITVDFHQVNNRDPFIYKTTDYGKTWTAITNGIPHSMLSYAHCIREDPVRQGLLFVGTENGLYVSFNDGRSWQPLQANLPHAPVYWIAMQEHFHDMVLATYGRGFWILDDLTPLEQLAPDTANAGAVLFAPRDAYRFRTAAQPESMTYDATIGQNPPYGASINYYLTSAPAGGARITIVDASGRTVRTMAGPAQPGINRLWWDLRFSPTKPLRLRTKPLYAPEITMGPDGYRPAPAGQPMALLAPPGTYTVRLLVDGREYSKLLKVIKDPHSNGTEGDIQIQTKLMSSLSGELNNMVDAVNQIESLRAQAADLKGALGTDEGGASLRAAADQLNARLIEIEENLIRLKATGRGQDTVRWTPELIDKIGYLANEVESSDFQPTTQQVAVHDELKEQAATYQQRLKLLLEKDVARFNALLRQRNVPNIVTNVP